MDANKDDRESLDSESSRASSDSIKFSPPQPSILPPYYELGPDNTLINVRSRDRMIANVIRDDHNAYDRERSASSFLQEAPLKSSIQTAMESESAGSPNSSVQDTPQSKVASPSKSPKTKGKAPMKIPDDKSSALITEVHPNIITRASPPPVASSNPQIGAQITRPPTPTLSTQEKEALPEGLVSSSPTSRTITPPGMLNRARLMSKIHLPKGPIFKKSSTIRRVTVDNAPPPVPALPSDIKPRSLSEPSSRTSIDVGPQKASDANHRKSSPLIQDPVVSTSQPQQDRNSLTSSGSVGFSGHSGQPLLPDSSSGSNTDNNSKRESGSTMSSQTASSRPRSMGQGSVVEAREVFGGPIGEASAVGSDDGKNKDDSTKAAVGSAEESKRNSKSSIFGTIKSRFFSSSKKK
ncbi:hypothetical protein SeMB42_g05931 [Synchytrium endobioticum]|uniref:Uncharacterized protein n=1 Tax=Synchytrium endobioticum TaxID=286115 RepID=A0A507CHN2_9FUNG|nr:hypothetical protein SeLEV6574_g07444 [Synchytrium endobioticum]TPX40582.1 hypothetical protein SeMB42_g05931 [Synchytrium endobioticum]